MSVLLQYHRETERGERERQRQREIERDRERESNFTDAFTLCLTFSVAASILDRCQSAPLRLANWQDYRVRETRALLPHETVWLRPHTSAESGMSS